MSHVDVNLEMELQAVTTGRLCNRQLLQGLSPTQVQSTKQHTLHSQTGALQTPQHLGAVTPQPTDEFIRISNIDVGSKYVISCICNPNQQAWQNRSVSGESLES